MPKKIAVIILDIGLILLAYSAIIYWKLEPGTYNNPFFNYQLLNWIPYLGAFLAACGFVFIILGLKNRTT